MHLWAYLRQIVQCFVVSEMHAGQLCQAILVKKIVIEFMIMFRRRMYQSNFLWWVERFRDFNDLLCEHNEKELVVLSLFHFWVDLLLFLRWCVRKFSSLQSFTEFSQKFIWWQTVYEWIITFFKTDQCKCAVKCGICFNVTMTNS